MTEFLYQSKPASLRAADKAATGSVAVLRSQRRAAPNVGSSRAAAALAGLAQLRARRAPVHWQGHSSQVAGPVVSYAQGPIQMVTYRPSMAQAGTALGVVAAAVGHLAALPALTMVGGAAAVGGALYLAHQAWTGSPTPAVIAPAAGRKKRSNKKPGKGVVFKVQPARKKIAPPAAMVLPPAVPAGLSLDLDDTLTKNAKAKARRKEREAENRAEAGRLRLAREAAAALAAREARVAAYPLLVHRSDNDFQNNVNDRDQGKAHLVAAGLRPAGNIAITAAEQLDQDSPNKGSSSTISFAGPNKTNRTSYGRETIAVKMRKLARAKEKGKADTANIALATRQEITASLAGHADQERLSNFARVDDEHQIRVRAGAIPPRFMHGAGLPNVHDSDSDDDH